MDRSEYMHGSLLNFSTSFSDPKFIAKAMKQSGMQSVSAPIY